MSETLNNQIPLNTIVAPSLNDAHYASGLNNVFTNINDNFTTLANHDFVKGESGTSVEIKTDSFFNEDGSLTILGKKLQYCINTISAREDEYSPVITNAGQSIGVFDYFNENPGNIYMIYNTVNDVNTQVPIAKSSLYYVFLDGRYATPLMNQIDETQYTNIRDFSCVLVYDDALKSVIDGHEVNGGFRALANAFPTIYYESGVGLCWKVNGSGTGIPVQGMPGRDGLNSTLHLVKCNSVEVVDTIIKGEVTGIYGAFDGYYEIDADTDISHLDNCSALILSPNAEGDGNVFYFGTLRVRTIEGDPIYNEETGEYTDNIVTKLYAYCNQENAINYSIELETFINAMKSISILHKGEDGSSGMKGLFIPMKHEDENTNKQPVHLLSATSITNTEGQLSDLKTDVVFTPVNDINSLNVTGDRDDMGADEGNLMVDKYLYVRISDRSGILNENNINYSDGIDYDKITKYDFVLKYKLTAVVKNTRDNDGNANRYFDAFANDNYDIGSRAFGRVKAEVIIPDNVIMQIEPPKEAVSLNDSNVKYYKHDDNDVYTNETTADHFETMPSAFKKRLDGDNPLGIYRWELCKDYAVYDVDELQAAGPNESVEDTYYTFENKFSVIYTTTVSPGVSSDFMWFDGMQLVNNTLDSNNLGGWDFTDGKYIINGWSNPAGDDPLFEFIKFVPIYDNDFRVNEDTALNINYNVNITGDDNNPNKNITVHGSVNCDNLSVYKLTATGEIQNIYTKDTIVGEGGIMLGSVTLNKGEENEHTGPAFTVDADGLVTANGGIFARYINCLNDDVNVKDHTVLADTIELRQLNTSEFQFDDNTNTRRLFIGNTGTADKYRLGFEINQSEGISITRYNDQYWIVDPNNIGKYNTSDNSDVPVISSELPMIQNGESSILVSNQPASSTQLCFDGALSKLGSSHPGTGVTVSQDDLNIKSVDFDVVKNFNIHRLAAASKNASVKTTPRAAVSTAQTKIETRDRTTSLESDMTYAIAYFSPDTVKGTEYIEKAVIKKSSQSAYLEPSNTIKVIFANAYGCNIGIRGECSNGRWPIMYKSSSYVDIHLAYSIDNGPLFELKKYNFDISNATNTYDNDGGNEWTGGQSSNYNNIWRYYKYKFRPTNYTIQSSSASTGDFTRIRTAYNEGKEIAFYTYMTFSLRSIGQKNIWKNPKEVVSGISITRPIVLSGTSSASTTTMLISQGAGQWGVSNAGSSNIMICYTEGDANTNSTVKTTTICNDGIVTRAGDYTFGLGYSGNIVDHKSGGYDTVSADNPTWAITAGVTNVPVLFYYKNDPNYYKDGEPKTGGKDNTGYAKRIHAIPLSDIFGAIRTIRSSSLTKYGL